MAEESNNYQALFVAAIDFGTTYSGYAFSSKSDFDKDPCKINANVWNAGGQSLLSYKAPTVVLLNPDRTFNSFGYDAENKFTQLIEDDEGYENYFYFHRFKMILHNQKIRRDTQILDEGNRHKISAKIIFREAIRYLSEHLFKSITDKVNGIRKNDILYVLTVPAIWEDGAKSFMRECAQEAGIERLLIALEPEAASLYCQNLQVERPNIGTQPLLSSVSTGTKYMVCDLGGGTTDITVHERRADGTLKEILPASGGSWGGTSVDNSFIKFLGEIFGHENIKALRAESLEDYLDIMRDFETKKRKIGTVADDTIGKTSITIPVVLSEIVAKDKNRGTLKNAVENCRLSEHLRFAKQKLQINNDMFRELFEDTIKHIIDHVQQLLQKNECAHLKHILMVGGLSECELVQNRFKRKFNNKNVIVPFEAGMAVMKGAVIFGHTPRAITTRVSRYTYGIQSWPEFDPRRHPSSKKTRIDGVDRCKDAFFKYIEVGQAVTPGHRESQIFQVLKPKEPTLECILFKSPRSDPLLTDEDETERLGMLSIPLGDDWEGPIEVEETLIFGDTELKIQAKNLLTNQMYQATFDLL